MKYKAQYHAHKEELKDFINSENEYEELSIKKDYIFNKDNKNSKRKLESKEDKIFKKIKHNEIRQKKRRINWNE